MTIAPYKAVLRVPGLRLLTLIGLLARIPATAATMAITLHVLTSLGMGYGEAGAAAALGMAGLGVGGPIAGRMVDRMGLRPVLIITTAAQAVFWVAAPHLSFPMLLVFNFLNGILSIPIFGTLRQVIAAMVPAEQRRPAFALDSMSVELSYMIGPAAAVALVTGLNSHITLYGVGVGLVAAGLALIVLNPPTQSHEEEQTPAPAGAKRFWLTPSVITLLGVTMATTFILAATELSVVAVLNNGGATGWTGLVIGVWCLYSLVGGFIYGALQRGISPLVLVAGLGLLSVPIGLVGGGWWWLMLALIPGGLLTSPSLASTVDTISRWVPASARGEAMGLHGTALTLGIASGSPIAGAIIDAYGPAWGFAAAGGIGLLLVLVALPFWPRVPARVAEIPEPAVVPASASVSAPV